MTAGPSSTLGPPQYSSMSPEELQREYSPSSAIGGDYAPFIDQYVALSERAYADCDNVETVAYGNQPSQSFDIALPARTELPSPVVVYIHGGYWQALSKQQSFFGASEFVARGIAYAALDYTLAPMAGLDQIVEECRTALRTLVSRADALGIAPEQIYLAGSSAGAHLSAMCCVDFSNEVRPAGVVLLSGIYDLEPFVGISDNDAVGLDLLLARQLSPLLLTAESYPDTIISWGEHETLEFKRQSSAMAERLRNDDRRVEVFESPGRNHFDVVHDLVDLRTPLGRQLRHLIGQ